MIDDIKLFINKKTKYWTSRVDWDKLGPTRREIWEARWKRAKESK